MKHFYFRRFQQNANKTDVNQPTSSHICCNASVESADAKQRVIIKVIPIIVRLTPFRLPWWAQSGGILTELASYAGDHHAKGLNGMLEA